MVTEFDQITSDISTVDEAGLSVNINKNKQIPTFKCPSCLQHQSLYEYAINNSGVVTPTFNCHCGYSENIAITGWDSTKYKNEHAVYIASI